jgi:hypothetical protein
MELLARHLRLAALILATAAVSACNGSLSINLTDTPVDNATQVVVDFTGIQLHNTDGSTVSINFPTARQIDLLQLQNGITTALAQGASVPTGNYDSIQLQILATQNTQGQSYITLNTGQQYPLYVPSGSETGLTLNTPFKVSQGGTTQLIIEFDLRQSIQTSDGQNYTATVDLAALTSQQLGSGAQISQCAGGLFVFSGAAVTPQNGGGASLVDFLPLPYNGEETQVALSFAFLASGSYTLAATCNYNLYDPTAIPGGSGYQAMHWMVLQNVSVTANGTTTDSLPSGSISNVVN